MLNSTLFFNSIQGNEDTKLLVHCYTLNTFTIIYFKK